MNSPYSGESASPYSDHSLGVPSPPTVVAAFNRPYDGECEGWDGLTLRQAMSGVCCVP